MTREHIFARWLVRQVHGARLFTSNAVLEAKPSPAAQLRISRAVASVCAECNAGWMSGLEVSFSGVLFGRPRTGVLQAADRVTLSRWFTKTAVLLAHTHGAALVDAAQRPQLLVGMPGGVEVFLARRRRPRQKLDFAVAVGDAALTRVGAVAIQIDDVVAHVAPRATLTSASGTRLWPLRSHALRWETLPVITSFMMRAAK
jgi:hypothetical protein